MKIHFIGIGGIGMSALARLYLARGYEISGSDAEDSAILKALSKEGSKVSVGHATANLPAKLDMVVYTEAILVDNPELKEVRNRGICVRTYFEALGEISAEFKTIAVAGTHGKTTTTAILSRILLQSGYDPTIVIGTNMKELGGRNFHAGKGEWMVVEACEYRRSFLHLQPKMVVLTNLELDHPDYYLDLDDYLSAFKELVSKLPANGLVVANGDNENTVKVAKMAPCEVVYFSSKGADLEKFKLKVPGKHNLMNALAAYAVGTSIGVSDAEMFKAINSFAGSWRRFEYKGDLNGAPVYDDYAHHPTEVQAALSGAREKYPDRRLVVVFEPHQYNRTWHFLKEFAQSFKDADEVIIPSIYKVRDKKEDLEAVSPEKLVYELQKYHSNVRFGDGFEKTVEYLRGSIRESDLVLVMGAGPVWQIAEKCVSLGINNLI